MSSYKLNNENYINIGVWKGFSLIAGMINTNCSVYGVDNFSEFNGPRNELIKNFDLLKNDKKQGLFKVFDSKTF